MLTQSGADFAVDMMAWFGGLALLTLGISASAWIMAKADQIKRKERK